jgi:hypothetical protein
MAAALGAATVAIDAAAAALWATDTLTCSLFIDIPYQRGEREREREREQQHSHALISADSASLA